MKRLVTAIAGAVILAGSAQAQDAKKAAPAQKAAVAPAVAGLETTQQMASYGLGLSLGKNFKAQGVDLDVELMVRGLRDGLTNAKSLLSDEQIEQALQVFQQELIAKQQEQAKVMAEESKKVGADFLAANAKKPGVKATQSGLQYKVLTEGTGPMPKETEVVKVHYRGTLTDGTVFDSSYERGEPATFPVNRVIQGWIEALQLMKVGSKWQVTIPSAMAYGENPPPGSPIPPNAVLLFDIELLGIEK